MTRASLSAASRSPAFRFGLPLVLFCTSGYLALSHFTGAVVEKRDARVVRRSERAVQLEQAHAAVVGKLNMNERPLVLKPIHRPPE
jgi:hypothetical protein